MWFSLNVPPRHEGRIAIVTARGVGCGGRLGSQHGSCRADERREAHVENVWSWHPDADATLAVTMIRWSRGQESPVPGESTHKA